MLSTGGQATSTELRFQRPGDSSLAPTVATLSHAAGSTVTGVVLPGTRVVLAVAQPARVRDTSFASALYRLEAGAPARLLAEGVAVASRPFLTRAGTVLLQRGRPGLAPTDGQYREDEVTVDEVDPTTGATRTLHAALGYALVPVGQLGRELILYFVDAGGAHLLARHLDSGAVRTLGAPFPATAHDFVADDPQGRLLFTAARAPAPGWGVFAVEARTGERHELARGPSMALLPTLLRGRVAFQPSAGTGLVDTTGGRTLLAPRGGGFERVRLVVQGLALGLHETPSEFPMAFAVSLDDGRSLAFPTAPDCRLDLAGVLP